MAAVAKWRDDIHGIIVTTGSGTAYTAASSQVVTSNANDYTIQFTPGSTNTGPVTLSVDSNTPQPLRFLTGVDLPAGVLISGSLYQASYRAATSEWLLHSSPLAQPFLIPVGGIIDYGGATAPNVNFVLPQGQAINRATYATLFSLFSTTYGSGDGSTTFNVPDLVGRVVAMRDGGSARLSTSYFGSNPANLGAANGSESSMLVTANLPAYTPAGSVGITDPGHAHTFTAIEQTGGNVVAGGSTTNHNNASTSTTGAATGISATFSGAAQGGTSTPFRTVQPTIVLNKILRVI